MNCDHPGCRCESEYSRSRWLSTGGLLVEYFCKNHAPADATLFDDDEAEDEASSASEEKTCL